MLMPAMTGSEWASGIATQIVLFRDWIPSRASQISEDDRLNWERLRYAGVVKVNGALAESNGCFETVVPFTVDSRGVHELQMPSAELAIQIHSSPTKGVKRSFVEIADSEDEDGNLLNEEYEWADDEELVAEGLVVDEETLVNVIDADAKDSDREDDQLAETSAAPG